MEESLRADLAKVDAALDQLLETARQIRPSSWRLVPTRIESFPSGQNAITAYVEDGNSTEGITFWFEIHASNYHDTKPTPPQAPWRIETDLYVDGNEGRTDCVYSDATEASDPVATVRGLNRAVRDITLRLAEKPPSASVWREGGSRA
jgi:hypothetical protein